jgi:hypothetical protein
VNQCVSNRRHGEALLGASVPALAELRGTNRKK